MWSHALSHQRDLKAALLMTDEKLKLPSGSDFPSMFAHQILQCMMKCGPSRALFSHLSKLRGITSPEPMWKINRGAVEPQQKNTSSGYLSLLEQLRSTAWAWGPITLPAPATLHRAIQISCPKIANNYLFIGRWGRRGKLGQCRGASWWIETLVKSCSRKQLTQEYPLHGCLTRCQGNKVSSLAPQPRADTPEWR